MNRLRNKTCYLIGAIDRANDLGATWRSEITPILTSMGVNVYNPLEKPIDTGLEDVKSRIRRNKLKKQGKFKRLSIEGRVIRRVDLRMVDKADFLICYLDLDIFACGTFEEAFLANRQKKPVIFICKQGVINMPDWLFWTFPYEMFFNDFDEATNYLHRVDDGTNNKHLNRWLFFDR